MYKLTFKKRVWIVKQYKKGVLASKIGFAQQVNRQDCIRHYNENRLHVSLQYRTPKEIWHELTV